MLEKYLHEKVIILYCNADTQRDKKQTDIGTHTCTLVFANVYFVLQTYGVQT